MRSEEYINDFLSEVGKIWKKYPNIPLGQLLFNANGHYLVFAEDEDLIKGLERRYIPKEEWHINSK